MNERLRGRRRGTVRLSIRVLDAIMLFCRPSAQRKGSKIAGNVTVMISLLSLYGCQGVFDDMPNNSSPSSCAGVVLTLDDRNIEDWCLSDRLLSKYGARFTFCVSHFNTLTGDEIDMLRELESKGHEISCHGLRHLNAMEFCRTHTVSQYIEEDILPAMDLMREYGFDTKTFAYPYGANTVETDAKLLYYFDLLRDASSGGISQPPQSYYFDFYNKARVVSSIGMDRNYGLSENEVFEGLQYALEYDCAIVFFGHRISDKGDEYAISCSLLEKVCEFVVEHGMNFYTLSDLK